MAFFSVLLIIIPVFTALVIYLYKHSAVKYLTFIAQLAMTILAVLYYREFSDQWASTLIVFGDWDLRIGISLINDEISMSFIFLTLFSFWMVLIYTFDTRQSNRTFLFFLMFLQGVFLGLLQTYDLFNMFVFLELTTILVTILIAFKKSGDSFRAAVYYILLNASGVLVFLIGVIIMYNVFGTINVGVIGEAIDSVGEATSVRFAYVLMMAGIAVKSALFPVFSWLPKAHGVAQSAISALLSGLIVKGGLYMFIRINQMFSGANLESGEFFFYVGAATAVVGVLFAVSQKDIKQILAYHTVSQIGIVMMGLSSPDFDTFYGGLLHIFNHALFKSLLFLGAGVIIKAYRTKYVSDMRGVFKTMPAVSIFMIVGMLSITGAPLFNGFISKTIIKYSIEDSTLKSWILFGVNIGTATSFIKMSQIFFGPRRMTLRLYAPFDRIALMGFAFACVILGNFYIPISDGFFGVELSYISVFNFDAFFDYFVALAIGFLIYYFIIKKDYRPIRMIREYKPSFQSANFVFIMFVVVMSVYFVLIP